MESNIFYQESYSLPVITLTIGKLEDHSRSFPFRRLEETDQPELADRLDETPRLDVAFGAQCCCSRRRRCFLFLPRPPHLLLPHCPLLLRCCHPFVTPFSFERTIPRVQTHRTNRPCSQVYRRPIGTTQISREFEPVAVVALVVVVIISSTSSFLARGQVLSGVVERVSNVPAGPGMKYLVCTWCVRYTEISKPLSPLERERADGKLTASITFTSP
jgi:hypothetical protein